MSRRSLEQARGGYGVTLYECRSSRWAAASAFAQATGVAVLARPDLGSKICPRGFKVATPSIHPVFDAEVFGSAQPRSEAVGQPVRCPHWIVAATVNRAVARA